VLHLFQKKKDTGGLSSWHWPDSNRRHLAPRTHPRTQPCVRGALTTELQYQCLAEELRINNRRCADSELCGVSGSLSSRLSGVCPEVTCCLRRPCHRFWGPADTFRHFSTPVDTYCQRHGWYISRSSRLYIRIVH
jgi:hypothetical protein